MNSVQIIGRLSADPDIRTTQGGKSVANFSLAVKRIGKDQPDWIDCVAWSNSAEILRKYAKQGDQIGSTGHLQTRTYQDKNGNNRKVTEVIAEAVDLLGRRESVPQSAPQHEEPEDDDDLPF